MLSAQRDNAARAIASTLKGITAATEELRWDRWRLPLSNGKPVVAIARLEYDWLRVEATLPDTKSVPEPWPLIVANTHLGGFARFAFDERTGQPRLLAEIPIAGHPDPAVELREACTGLEQGLELLSRFEKRPGAATGPEFWSAPVAETRHCEPDVEAEAAAGRVDLADLCAEAGWTGHPRQQDLVIDLEAGPEFWQARLGFEPESDVDSLRVSVGLELDETLSEAGRTALGIFLLQATGTTRWVRASSPDQAGAPRFEVLFARPPSSAALHEALCALSVACRFFGREARLIQVETVSSRYLELRRPAHHHDVARPAGGDQEGGSKNG